MYTEAQQFSDRLKSQLKACGLPAKAMYLAREIHVTPQTSRLWLIGVNIPNDSHIQTLAHLLKVNPRWLRYGGVLEDSFVSEYLSLCEGDRATVRAVVGAMWRGGNVST